MDSIAPKEKIFVLHDALFWLLIGCVLLIGFTASVTIGLSFWYSILGVALLIGFFLFRESPLFFLGLLIVIRMSLDITSENWWLTFFERPVSLSQLFGIAIALLGLVIIGKRRSALLSFPLSPPFFLLLLWSGITLFTSISPLLSSQEITRVFDIFTLSLLAYTETKTLSDFKALLQAVVLSALLPTTIGLYQFIVGIGFTDPNITTPRIYGTFAHPNVFSLYLFVLLVVLVIYISQYSKTIQSQIGFGLYLFMVLIVLVLTFSRVAWISTFLFILALALYRYRSLLVPLLFVPLAVIALSPTVNDRVADTFRTDPDSSFTWRLELWSDVLTQATYDDQIFWGSGINTFSLISEGLSMKRYGSNDAHNDYVKFFIEGGLVGLSVFLTFLALIAVRLFQEFRFPSVGALSPVYGILFLVFIIFQVAALTDNVFKNTPIQWIFFILLGAALGVSQHRRMRNETK